MRDISLVLRYFSLPAHATVSFLFIDVCKLSMTKKQTVSVSLVEMIIFNHKSPGTIEVAHFSRQWTEK